MLLLWQVLCELVAAAVKQTGTKLPRIIHMSSEYLMFKHLYTPSFQFCLSVNKQQAISEKVCMSLTLQCALSCHPNSLIKTQDHFIH